MPPKGRAPRKPKAASGLTEPSDSRQAEGVDEASQQAGEWLTRRQAAGRLGVHYNTVRDWSRIEGVRTRRVGRTSTELVLLEDLRRIAEERGRLAPQSPLEGSGGPQEATGEPPGALIPLKDLAPLFDRLADAERRAVNAEERLAFREDELGRLRGELEELRRRRRWWRKGGV